MKFPLPLILALSFYTNPDAYITSLDLEFFPTGGSAELEMYVTPVRSSKNTVNYSGTIKATLTIDTTSLKAISYTAAREKLAARMDQVCEDREAVIITRKRNQSVVMLSLEDYTSLEETAYLLRSPANAKWLQAAMESLESGEGQEKKLVGKVEE